MTSPRVLVLGAAGMLGHRVWRELAEHTTAFAAVRRSARDYAPLGWFDGSRLIDGIDVSHEEPWRSLAPLPPPAAS